MHQQVVVSKIVYFLLASWTPLGILVDAMITKHIVEATTGALALSFAIGAVAFPFFFYLHKKERDLTRRARKTKR